MRTAGSTARPTGDVGLEGIARRLAGVALALAVALTTWGAAGARAEAPETPPGGAAALTLGEEWHGDASAYMVAMEILVVEINENRTRELGLNYGLARRDGSGAVLEGASLLVGPVRGATAVPTFSGDALGR
jgi:hypothetical protein